MKRITCLIVALLASASAHAFNDNEWSVKDTAITVRLWRIDLTTSGVSSYFDTTAQKNAADAKLTSDGITHSVVALSQAADDIAISTSVKFAGFEEFRRCMTTQSGVVAKIKQLGIDAAGWGQLLTWFPGQSATLQPIIDDLKHQVQLLYRPYAGLAP